MSEQDNTVFVNYEKLKPDESLEQLYKELGKAYYEGGFEDPLPQLLSYFDKITMLKHPISEVAQCSNCKEALEDEALFCGNCGYSVNKGETRDEVSKM